MKRILYFLIAYGLCNALVEAFMLISIKNGFDFGLRLFYFIPSTIQFKLAILSAIFFLFSIIYLVVSFIFKKQINKFVILLSVISNFIFLRLFLNSMIYY